MMNDDELDSFMLELIENGALEPHGVDADGEIIYQFNMKILKQVSPQMYNSVMDDLDKDLMQLYELGLVDISYDENLNATFSASEKGREYMESDVLEQYLLDNDNS